MIGHLHDTDATPGRPAPAAAPQPRPACITCGGEVPAGEAECAFCAHARAAEAPGRGSLLLHWLVFLAAMAVVFGLGWVLMP